ncbi:MAG: hypothetical protein CSA70_05675 [Rhodobacterales bacterium]|nr:MAG: hypothetical protein CSA70_05675 [Rhodobacterales bacterium]
MALGQGFGHGQAVCDHIPFDILHDRQQPGKDQLEKLRSPVKRSWGMGHGAWGMGKRLAPLITEGD